MILSDSLSTRDLTTVDGSLMDEGCVPRLLAGEADARHG